MCIYDADTQLTFRSVRDEFNREREGSTMGYGLWIQIDLREIKKMEGKKRGWWGQTKGRRMKRKERQQHSSEERLRLYKPLVKMLSMSFFPFGSPRHGRSSSVPAVTIQI